MSWAFRARKASRSFSFLFLFGHHFESPDAILKRRSRLALGLARRARVASRRAGPRRATGVVSSCGRAHSSSALARASSASAAAFARASSASAAAARSTASCASATSRAARRRSVAATSIATWATWQTQRRNSVARLVRCWYERSRLRRRIPAATSARRATPKRHSCSARPMVLMQRFSATAARAAAPARALAPAYVVSSSEPLGSSTGLGGNRAGLGVWRSLAGLGNRSGLSRGAAAPSGASARRVRLAATRRLARTAAPARSAAGGVGGRRGRRATGTRRGPGRRCGAPPSQVRAGHDVFSARRVSRTASTFHGAAPALHGRALRLLVSIRSASRTATTVSPGGARGRGVAIPSSSASACCLRRRSFSSAGETAG